MTWKTKPSRTRRAISAFAGAAMLCSVGAAAPSNAGAAEPAGGDAPWSNTHGAGVNKPNYNNGRVNFRYHCIPGMNRFKVDQATIVMWSNGARIKGFHFKYKVKPAGPGTGAAYNWSENREWTFDQGTKEAKWMSAGKLDQSYGDDAAWAIEVKLKYPRSLRPAYRYQYQFPIVTPSCGD